MKLTKLKNMWMLLLLATGNPGMAQENMMKTVRRLIRDYPSARHRIEYRYEPEDSGRALHEVRFDFRIHRDSLRPADSEALMKLYAKAWDAANPRTDRMQQYAHRDSICSTIVYGAEEDKDVNLQHRGNLYQFWGGPGYLLFDAGREMAVVADKLEYISRMPRKPDFNDIMNVVDSLCKGHRVKETAVRYTGHEGSFVFQRTKGRGWTRGRRYTVEGCTRTNFDLLRNAFMARFEGKEAVDLIAYNDEIMLKSEMGPEFFIASFRDGGTLYFLSATVEDEICIPKDWEHTDCYNNGRVAYVDVSRLDSLYDELSARVLVPPVAVQYTGGMSSEITGFQWQRGWGKGWTRGRRLELSGITLEDKARILSVFGSYRNILGQVNIGANQAATYEEGTRTFYGFEQTADGRAFFLRATTENEICIPRDWTVRNYFKGSEEPATKANALTQASKQVQYLYGLGNLWSGVRQNFVFMDRVSVNWDSLYVAMIPRMMKAEDNRQAVRLLQEMTARLQDGHTYVYELKTNSCTAPVFTKRIGGHVYIDDVVSSNLQKHGIRRGQEIVAINGMPVDDYVRRFIQPYASSSTPQWTEHICYEDRGLMKWDLGEKVVWTLKDGDRRFDYHYDSGTERWDLYSSRQPLSFSVLDNHIGYLKITSFGTSEVTELFDSIYPSLLATKALVIDIRGNGGGNSGYSEYIIKHFATDTLRSSSWQSPMYIPAFASWGYERQWHRVESKKMSLIRDREIYTRPVVLLVDNGTFSAAEDFCAMFLSIKRGKLIGRPTGGSTGNGVRVELIPGVAMANICSKYDTAADGTEFVGHGFTPDILVEETYRSYFIDKRDAALTAACKVLEGELKKRK